MRAWEDPAGASRSRAPQCWQTRAGHRGKEETEQAEVCGCGRWIDEVDPASFCVPCLVFKLAEIRRMAQAIAENIRVMRTYYSHCTLPTSPRCYLLPDVQAFISHET